MSQPLEIFSANDLASLRQDLLRSGLDHWQAADLIGIFLSGRGYGVSSDEARIAASRIESVGCSMKSLREELSKIALHM